MCLTVPVSLLCSVSFLVLYFGYCIFVFVFLPGFSAAFWFVVLCSFVFNPN